MAWYDRFQENARRAAEREARTQSRRSGKPVNDKMLKTIMGHMMQSGARQMPVLEGTTPGNQQRMMQHNAGALNTDASVLNAVAGPPLQSGAYYDIGGFPGAAMMVAMQNPNHPEHMAKFLQRHKREWKEAPNTIGMYNHARFPQWWDRPY